MRNWCSWMSFGRISAPSTSPRRWRRMGGVSGDSVHALAERPMSERRALRWSDLGIRVVSAAVLAPIALACIWLGGVAFTVLVAAAALGLAIEWLMLCRLPTARAGGSPLRIAGIAYV